MCIKQIKIRLYKWIYKFLQIGCQVEKTILSVIYSDRLMQYQLAKNSIKTQTKQQLIERNLKNSTITTYNIIKLSLIFKMKKISNHQLFKKKNLLQKEKKKSKFEKSNSKKIYKLNSILHYIHTTQFLFHNFPQYSIILKKKKRKKNLLISAYVSNIHIEHTPNPK